MNFRDLFKRKNPRPKKGQQWKAKYSNLVVNVGLVSKRLVRYSYDTRSGKRVSYLTSVRDFMLDFAPIPKKKDGS